MTAAAELSTPLSHGTFPKVERPAVLAEADRLFYSAGVGATTMKDVAKAAGISRGRLAKMYPTKESLAVAYLEARHEDDVQTLEALRASGMPPTQILDAVLQGVINDLLAQNFRGCAFLNAAAEAGFDYPEVARTVREHRDWFSREATRLLREAGHPVPADAADDLVMARDGGMASIHGGNVIAAVGAMKRSIQRAFGDIEHSG
jgi:AcrR family transcriptional regulator